MRTKSVVIVVHPVVIVVLLFKGAPEARRGFPSGI
jgi:hypothetical protein